MKRHMALLIAAVMAASSLPTSVYAAGFKDMDDLPWAGAEKVISSVADLGLLNGYEDNTFRAKNNVTYCEAMQMVYSTLIKSGVAQPLEASAAFQYYSVMNTYGIPAWAQTAVAYGLNQQIISMQDMMKFVTNGQSNAATREDVAMMFGNALSASYETASSSDSAAQFRDYWSISANAVAQVDLLKRLGIVSGDESNQFRPKNNINRAEMAVMLNKTYEVLKQGIGSTATITGINRNGDNYSFDVKMEDGTSETFSAPAGTVKLYDGNSNTELSLSRLAVGDTVSVIHKNFELQSMRLLKGTTDQQKYDVTGYITKATTAGFTLENDNTGETSEYSYSSSCLIYLDDKKVTAKELKDTISDRSDEFAYAKLLLSSEVQRESREDKESSTAYRSKEEVLRVVEVYVSFSKESTATGTVSDLTQKNIGIRALGTGQEKMITYAEDCTFYYGEDKITLDRAVQLGDSGTIYAKVQLNQQQKATKVTLSEESFDTKANEAVSKITYELAGFTESSISVRGTDGKVTYQFGSVNPTKNIRFYIWTGSGEWDSVSEKSARNYYLDPPEDYEDKDETYCRLEFNSGGKISAIYLSYVKAAWRKSGEQTEKKGNVSSLEGNILKLEGSSVEYTLLSQYNKTYDSDGGKRDDSIYIGKGPDGDYVRYPLTIDGAVTSSLSVFERAAKSKNVKMYVELVADADNRVIGIEARIVSAKGTLVEYDRDDKEITIQLETGEKLKLQTASNPKLTDADDKTFTLDDVAGTSYVGATVELECGGSGVVNKITVTNDSAGVGFGRVTGTATAGKDGLQVKGVDGVFPWVNRKDIIIRNDSMPSESLEKLKEILEDDALEAYVVASLNERKYVSEIRVTIKAAEGTLEEYKDDDHLIRIKTKDGGIFSFNVVQKPSCDVGGVKLADLDEDCRGKFITLSFDDKGLVSGIKG